MLDATARLAVISTIQVAPSVSRALSGGFGLRSERPLILLVVPVALVQAPNYLLAHRGIAGHRDREALLRDDLAAPCLDREMFRSERQAPIGPVRALPGHGYASKKLNSI